MFSFFTLFWSNLKLKTPFPFDWCRFTLLPFKTSFLNIRFNEKFLHIYLFKLKKKDKKRIISLLIWEHSCQKELFITFESKCFSVIRFFCRDNYNLTFLEFRLICFKVWLVEERTQNLYLFIYFLSILHWDTADPHLIQTFVFYSSIFHGCLFYKTVQSRNLRKMCRFHCKLVSFLMSVIFTGMDKHTSLPRNL